MASSKPNWSRGARKNYHQRICVLMSGGIDSAVLAADMLRRGCEVHPLYIRCGLFWEEAEIAGLRRFLKAIKTPALKPLAIAGAPMNAILGDHWSFTGRGVPSASSRDESVYIPGRNLVLLSQAALFSISRDIRSIAMGVLKGNPFPDATPRFRKIMEQALRANFHRRIKITAPYANKSKKDVIHLIEGLPLHLTFSCMKPQRSKPCGRCNKCAERRKALS